MEQKKKRNPLMTLINFAFLALAVTAIGIAAVMMLVKTPLGEPMSLAAATSTPEAQPAAATPTVEAAAGADAAGAAAAPSSKGKCGATGTQMILFVGADDSRGVWPNGADAVRLVKVDYDQNKITVIAFPRDLWVKTPQLASQNFNETRLGLAYRYMKDATNGENKHKVTVATGLVGQILQEQFGVTADQYITVQMDNLPEMVDAMGGVDINIPESFTSEREVKFEAGQQKLAGEKALEYIRTFTPGGDGARRQRQNVFVKATQQTLLTLGIVTKIPELAKTFDKVVFTDLNVQKIGELTCMLQNTQVNKISFYEIGDNLVSEQQKPGEKGTVLEPKVDLIKEQIRQWQGQ